MTVALHYTQSKRQNLICLLQQSQCFFFLTSNLISFGLIHSVHGRCPWNTPSMLLSQGLACAGPSEWMFSFQTPHTWLPCFLQDFIPASLSLQLSWATLSKTAYIPIHLFFFFFLVQVVLLKVIPGDAMREWGSETGKGGGQRGICYLEGHCCRQLG